VTLPFRLALAAVAASVSAATLMASERAPLPDNAFDSGIVSAETLGRGGTIASNRGTAASGSENPASLELTDTGGSLYATGLVATRSAFPDDVANARDPLAGKVVQYLAVGADKGVLFFEPVSRFRQSQIIDATAGTSRDVSVHANAIGFAGSQKWKAGSFGMSMAYLWSSMNVIDRSPAGITGVKKDTADGLRLNLGIRYPTGPSMWGLVVQNAPGILWGSNFRHTEIPLRIRAGNTYRLAKGVLFSLDGERRFYHGGGRGENYVYVGNESFVGKHVVLRVGAFGTSLSNSETRTLTGGASIVAGDNTQITYAMEQYQVGSEKVKRSLISLSIPFEASDNSDRPVKYQ